MVKCVVLNPTRIQVKGGTKAQKEARAAVADDMRQFLAQNIHSHIDVRELRDFYNQRFPSLNINVVNQRPKFPAMGWTIQNINKDTLKLKNCDIKIASTSLLDKIKSILGIIRNSDSVYIDDKFSQILIHEGTHALQAFMKPAYSIYLNELLKLSGNDRTLMVKRLNDKRRIFSKHVYNENLLSFSPKKFRKSIMNDLRKSEPNNDRVIMAHLKAMIRDAENEKEAYEVCKKQYELLKHPYLSENEDFQHFIDKKSKLDTDSDWDFDTKIIIMRDEYLKLANKIRNQNQN